MNTRRGFLSALLGGTAAAMVLDPEKLLWRPGEKLISIPKPAIPSYLENPILGDIYWSPKDEIYIHNGETWLRFNKIGTVGTSVTPVRYLPNEAISVRRSKQLTQNVRSWADAASNNG